MSENRWAPGPWRVVRPNHNPKEVYVRDVGGLIAQGQFPTHWEGQDERFAEAVDQYEANARLISAAPDLAEALDRAVSTLAMARERLEEAGFMSAARDCAEDEAAARAALSKARETP